MGVKSEVGGLDVVGDDTGLEGGKSSGAAGKKKAMKAEPDTAEKPKTRAVQRTEAKAAKAQAATQARGFYSSDGRMDAGEYRRLDLI